MEINKTGILFKTNRNKNEPNIVITKTSYIIFLTTLCKIIRSYVLTISGSCNFLFKVT